MSGEAQKLDPSTAAQPAEGAQPQGGRSSDAVVPDVGHYPRQWHFGLLDVPQPELFNPQGAKSLEEPQNAGTRLTAAVGNSPDTALCPLHPAQHSPGSERSRDAAMVATREGLRQSSEPQVDEATPESQQAGPARAAPQPIRPRPILPADTAQRKGSSPKELKLPAGDRIPSDGLGSGGSKPAFTASMPGVSASHLEGSATSDENNQPRLVPRKGAGPDLRTQGGSKIDEYLMKLLRHGAPQPPADPWIIQKGPAAEKSGLSASAQSGAKPAPSVTWQGSRLGPLAPGAGVRSSAVSRKTAPAALAGEKPKSASPTRQPSVPVVKKEAAQEPQYEQPERRGCAETLPKRASGEAAVRAAQDGRKGEAGRHEDACQGQADVAGSAAMQRVQQALGKEAWATQRNTIERQSREFQHQLAELHRMAAVQIQLQSQLRVLGAASLQAPPLPVLGRHPPLFVQPAGQAAVAAIAVPGQQPTLPVLPQPASWWPGSFPSQATSSGVSASRSQGGKGGRLSRTTQIALEAQRRRSKLRLAELTAQEKAASRRAAEQAASASEGKDASQQTPQPPPQQQQQVPWFSLVSPALMQPGLVAGSASAPASSLPQTSGGPQLSAGGAAALPSLDPLSAWYTYHFGQQPSFHGSIGPTAAHYSMQLAGLAMAQSDGDWEKHCHKYFNFSLPASSEATGPGSKQDPTAQGWQGLSGASQGQKRSHSLAFEDLRDGNPSGSRNPSRAPNHSNSVGKMPSCDRARGMEWDGSLAALESAARQVALAANRSPTGNSSGHAQRAN